MFGYTSTWASWKSASSPSSSPLEKGGGGGEGRRNIRHTERNGRKNVEAQRNGSGEWKAIKNKGNQSRKRLRSVGTETQCEKKNDDPATWSPRSVGTGTATPPVEDTKKSRLSRKSGAHDDANQQTRDHHRLLLIEFTVHHVLDDLAWSPLFCFPNRRRFVFLFLPVGFWIWYK